MSIKSISDFLDAHADAIRARDQAVRKDTDEQLKLFRQKQDAAPKTTSEALLDQEIGPDDATADLDMAWNTTRKRKRINGKDPGKSTKLQRSSSDTPSASTKTEIEPTTRATLPNKVDLKPPNKLEVIAPTNSTVKKPGLTLVYYGSDEDSDS